MRKNGKKFILTFGICASVIGCIALALSLQPSITKGKLEIKNNSFKITVDGRPSRHEPYDETGIDMIEVNGKILVNMREFSEATSGQWGVNKESLEIYGRGTYINNNYGAISKIIKGDGKVSIEVNGKIYVLSTPSDKNPGTDVYKNGELFKISDLKEKMYCSSIRFEYSDNFEERLVTRLEIGDPKENRTFFG